jgi:SAM-dependent methyltransferase
VVERLSLTDGSLFASYGDHIQRYEFALPYCRDKTVLDAGCGIGYGSHFLAMSGAKSVLAVDISRDAISEASASYGRENLSLEQRDVETLELDHALHDHFDVIVNFENLEHLQNPERFVRSAHRLLSAGGVLITSTPNGALGHVDAAGKPNNPFHVKEFTHEEFDRLLSPFSRREFFGQWATPSGLLRRRRGAELHEQLCELYYNPINRAWRILKRFLGKPICPPPTFSGMDAYPGDQVLAPIETPPVPWPPQVLLAVCRKA